MPITGGTDPNSPVNIPQDAPTSGSGGGDWIGALIGLGTTIYAANRTKAAQERANQYNKDAADLAYQRDLEMWNRMNAYNDPAAAFARLQNAGLNPNMMYGGGSGPGAAGQAAAAPKSPIPHYGMVTPMAASLPQVLGQYQDFQMRKAQIDNVKAQTDNVMSRTFNESLRANLLDIQGEYTQGKNVREGMRLNYDKAKFLQDYEHKESMHPIQLSRAMFARDSERELFPYAAEGAKYGVQRARYGVQEQLSKIALMSQEQQLNMLRAHKMKNSFVMDHWNQEMIRQRIREMQIREGREGQKGVTDRLKDSDNSEGLFQVILRGLGMMF